MMKICFAHCVFNLRNAGPKRFFFGDSSHLLEFCSVYLLEIARLICEKNLEHAEFKNSSLA